MEKMHGADLRKGRFSEIGRAYLLTAICDRRAALLSDWRIGRKVAEEFRRVQDRGDAESLAWVIMPDHFHWLCTLQNGTLAGVMQAVKSRSAIGINRTLGRTGAVWQSGYHDHAVREEEDLQDLARYVIANPVRAGLVKRIGDYPLWDAVWL